jgi:OOP family OmpA-OmpF porin
MKLSRMVLFMCSVFLFVFSMSHVSAENQPGAFTISPLFGGYLFEGDQDLRHRPSYGIGFGYNFNEHCSAEAVFNHVDTDSRADGINDQGDVDAFLYRLDGLYHFMPSKKLVPYIAVGAGVMTLDAKMGDKHVDNDFIANYGAGIKYFLNDVVALRADVRHVMTFPDNNLLYTAGLTFNLGGKKKAPPVEMSNDSDGDGVEDAMDKCPGTPAGVKVDKDGCPLDSDKDSVYDYLDKCPGTPIGATVDQRGCWVLKNVVFDTAKWEIKSQSFNSLDKAIDILKKNPSLKLEVQGHTDNKGTQKYNQILSEKRARAVVEYLMKKGISKDKLTSQGYGFSKPAATNETPEGRSQNRRVELKPVY